MKIYRLNLASVPVIAAEGENGAAGIAVPCGAWAEEHPQGSGTLGFRRADGEVYPLEARREGAFLPASLTAMETEAPGLCWVEAQWRAGPEGEETAVAKAGPYRFRVAPCAGGKIISPGQPAWADRVLEAAEAVRACGWRAGVQPAGGENVRLVLSRES